MVWAQHSSGSSESMCLGWVENNVGNDALCVIGLHWSCDKISQGGVGLPHGPGHVVLME